jgi:hypothetical protein
MFCQDDAMADRRGRRDFDAQRRRELAFEEFHRRHFESLRGLALRSLVDDHEASAVADISLREAFTRYSPAKGVPLIGFLFGRVFKDRLKDAIRRQSRQRKTTELSPDVDPLVGESSRWRQPENTVVEREYIMEIVGRIRATIDKRTRPGADNRAILHGVFDCLLKREFLWLDDTPEQESQLAAALGCQPERIAQAKARIQEFTRNVLDELGDH